LRFAIFDFRSAIGNRQSEKARHRA
jgi:hypothetical protein